MARVQLNIDLGELPNEPPELYALATTVNIAAGGHAGDLASMARALSMALARATRVAAHPSYPDRERFGRVSMEMGLAELQETIEEQCATLARVAGRMGCAVRAMKPHGALYHDAARSASVAGAVLDGTVAALGAADLLVVGPPTGALRDAALARGLGYAREGFADRAYTSEGTLVPRSEPGALITVPADCARQAIRLAQSGDVDTICLHGDTPGALDVARAVRDALIHSRLLAGEA